MAFALSLILCAALFLQPARAAGERRYLSNVYEGDEIYLRMDDGMEIDGYAGIYRSGTEVEVIETVARRSPNGNDVILCKVKIGVKEGWVLESELTDERPEDYEPVIATFFDQETQTLEIYRDREGFFGVGLIAAYPVDTPVEWLGKYSYMHHVKVGEVEGYTYALPQMGNEAYKSGWYNVYEPSIEAYKGPIEEGHWTATERDVYISLSEVEDFPWQEHLLSPSACDVPAAQAAQIGMNLMTYVYTFDEDDQPIANWEEQLDLFEFTVDGRHIWRIIYIDPEPKKDDIYIWIDAHDGCIVWLGGANIFG